MPHENLTCPDCGDVGYDQIGLRHHRKERYHCNTLKMLRDARAELAKERAWSKLSYTERTEHVLEALEIAVEALEKVNIEAAPIHPWKAQNELCNRIQHTVRTALDRIKKVDL